MAEQTALRQLISEPTALMDVEDLAGYTESNPLPVDDKDRQEAVRELGRRGITPPPEQPASAPEPTPEPTYKYGGDTFMGAFVPKRREILRPEYTQFLGYDFAGNALYQEIPAVYGEEEYDFSYAPLSSAVSAGIDAAKGIPSLLGFRGPTEKYEATSAMNSALRDMLFGTGEYIADQATAAMSGGAFFDPETERVVRFDPTIAMVGGNPATAGGTVLASGVRAPRVRPFQQYGGNLEEARNRLNITEESRKAWQATRSGFKQERPEELRIAAQKVADGEMTFDEYRALVQEVLPPERIGQLMDVPTFEEIALGLDKNPQNTAGIIGFNINIPDGTAASSRLDINAYENQGVWVNTIHEGGKQSGSVLGYGPTTVLNNVTFSSNPKQALEIAMGKSKTPIGRIDGTWENRDPKLVIEQVRSILDGTAPDAGDWVEVGMNPIRGSGFYNKATFELVGESDQILQVGPVVLAKRPTYIQPNDPRNMVMDRGQPRLDKSGNPVFFSGGGNTGTAIAAGSAASNVARLRRADEQGYGDVLYHATATREPIDAFAGDRLGLTYLTTDRDFANQWMGKGGARTRIEDFPDIEAEFERGVQELRQKYQRPDGTLSNPREYYREYDNLRKSLESTDQSIYPVRTRVQNTFDPTVDTDVLDDLIRMKGSDPDATSLQTGLTDRDVYQSGNYILYETPKVIEFLKERGFDSMRLSEGMDQPMTTVAVFDPAKIRSINAEFNPDRMGSANILYSGGGRTGTAVAAGSSIANAARSRPDFDMNTTYYHGTSSDFTEFTPSEVGDLGPGIYMTPNPEKASGYAAMRRFMRRDTNNASPNVMPLRLRKDLNFLDLQGRAIMPFDEDRIQRLRDSGYDGIRQLDESGNVTQLNIFDPENIRSVNAEFKPGESANILYSGGNTGTGIAVASALRNELERRLGGPIPEVDRDTTLLGRVGDVRRVNEMDVEMSAPVLSSFPIAKAEDLIDRAYMTGISDTSRSGLERVTAVDGVPVDSLQRGGFAFGMQPENIDRNIAFASAEGAVRGQLNRARAAQALSGRPGVVFVPHGMVGPSPDFATMSTDIAVPYAREVMNRADRRALDQRIREGAGNLSGAKAPIPDFPGIDRATAEYLSGIGGKRKNILQALDERPAQRAGALSRSQVRSIVTEPSEFNAPFGQVNAFYELDPRYYRERNPLDPVLSDHPSYAMALSGRPLGLAREGFSIFDLDPSMFGLDGIPAVRFMEELARRRRGAEQRLADALGGDPDDIAQARKNLRGYDFPGLYGDGGFGSSVQGMLKAGGQGVITQEMVDDLLRRGLIID